MASSSPDPQTIAIAFGFVAVAAACSPLGASVVLLMKRSATAMLAASIAAAAGVMLFISLVQVLPSGMALLQEGGVAPVLAQLYSYLGFFGGLPIVFLLDWLSGWVVRAGRRRRRLGPPASQSEGEGELGPVAKQGADAALDVEACEEAASGASSGASAEPRARTHAKADGVALPPPPPPPPPHVHCPAHAPLAEALEDEQCCKLSRTALMVGLAISLHNLPEGLATFVGFMSSPKTGATIALAIAMHNIPEGVAVGVPVFFATGSRWKGVAWAAASGCTELLGAVLGLAIALTGAMNNVAMGVVMSLVSGVMVGVSIHELIPSALEYDPRNRYTTYCVFGGMLAMATSLVLLGLWA